MKLSIQQAFDDAIEDIYENNSSIAAQIIKLGYPEIVTNMLPTAAVGWDKQYKKTKFFFNKHFFESLDQEQFKFILAHEASHIFTGTSFICEIKLKSSKQRERQRARLSGG